MNELDEDISHTSPDDLDIDTQFVLLRLKGYSVRAARWILSTPNEYYFYINQVRNVEPVNKRLETFSDAEFKRIVGDRFS